MVCMGNICRSPTAEGVLRHKLREAGVAALVVVDSAGTHGYHTGEPPDERAVRHARQRGYDLSALRARQITAADFERFDLLLAMDWDNLAELKELCPVEHRGKLRRLTEYAQRFDNPVVPDPYYGSAAAFEQVLDLVEDACAGLIAELATDGSERQG
ncbi:MAG: low molecular weight phosphotyrosine protein phosphatase [Betaproteobacteria bacterium]|nr:MAG: low molecular weight phosphotyrosine protein phosphatase [Betaproteobacteria bacterium]